MIHFIADAHAANHKRHGGAVEAGLNQRAREVIGTVAAARDIAKAEHTTLVALGDLLDSVRPEPQILAAVQKALSGVDVLALLGNHEQVSTAIGDHSLGPLNGHDMIAVVERPGVEVASGAALVLVPFQPGKADDWLPGVVDKLLEPSRHPDEPPRVLCLHLGIRDEKTPPWLAEAHDSVSIDLLRGLADAYHLEAIVAGNWHERRRWDLALDNRTCEVMQVGALVPTGWDNPGLRGYGTVARFDPRAPRGVSRLTHVELPGPRFLKLKAGDDVPPAKGNKLYVQVTAPIEDLAACESAVGDMLAAGEFVAAEVVPDAGQVEEAARDAAEQARSEDTLDGALAAFVERMSADEAKVDRARVLARCKGYLAAGGA